MDLSELNDRVLESYAGDLKTRNRILSIVKKDNPVFPFNRCELLISHLINSGGLDFDKYLKIRKEYLKRNRYLHVFENSPTTFGGRFAYSYLFGLCPSLKRASKKLDEYYDKEYDLFLDGIKTEVKASRVAESTTEGSLATRALFRNTEKKFKMNFQQLKPDLCDIFIWLAVFRDEVIVWVMSNTEVSNNPRYVPRQHRFSSGREGQLHVTKRNIHEFDKFQLLGNDLGDAIRNAHRRT